MTRVYLRPDAAAVADNNGIGRVVHAQARYLPQFDIELVGTPDRAEVVAGHTHDHGAPRIDAAHLHGLYWTAEPDSGEYGAWHREANARIIASVRRARVVTVPSDWVAEPFRRDMRLSPRVIGHGIEPDAWKPGANGGYVLWNKNRAGDVCDPRWARELAAAGHKVTTTFAPKDGRARPASLTITGELKSDAMRELIQNADVYLATTKETFGIGTLEALAAGVPVLGFDWGGTADILRGTRAGWLAKPGDLEGLLKGLEYIRAHRREMSDVARALARRYTWERVIGDYAQLYHDLAGAPEPTGVAVVITCHNYMQWLADCIESVLRQTYPVDEIIVVDDGSTDRSREVARRFEARGVRLLTQANSGVAAARNNGIAATRQPYVMCLDADDMLDPRYVQACREAMLADRGLGIAWTGLSVLREGRAPTGNVWTGVFDWEWQATPGNPPRTCIPTAAMFRRDLWERSGGYKQQHAPGEDAEFYTRGLSVGFTARQVTDLPLMLYRDHGSGAHKTLAYAPIDQWHPWMRDRQYPLGAPSIEAPPVRSYSDPKVSVIIPVGPGYWKYLPDTLESLLGQNMRDWEVIVVDDTDENEASILDRFPFARRVVSPYVGSGPGAARNRGLERARAPLCLFLDADDQLAPGGLAALCRAYAGADGRYIYGNWQAMGDATIRREAEYDPSAWLDFDDLGGKHAVTVLMATADARAVRFDEELPGWEDWDFFARCALAGIQGKHIDAVTLYVRPSLNGRTGQVMKVRDDLLIKLRTKHREAIMAKSCCGGNAAAALAAKSAWDGVPAETTGGLTVQRTATGRGSAPEIDPNLTQPVRMEFVGTRSGAVTYSGARGSGRQYRGGNNPINRFHNVHPEDVAVLEASGEWRRVAPLLTEITALAEQPAEQPIERAPELETLPEPALAAVAEAPAEQLHVIQTAEGPVKRKRQGGKRAEKNTPLRDLPPEA